MAEILCIIFNRKWNKSNFYLVYIMESIIKHKKGVYAYANKLEVLRWNIRLLKIATMMKLIML